MNRIILSIILLLYYFSSWAQSTDISKIAPLIYADSLFGRQQYSNVINFLIPLEQDIQKKDNSDLKVNYYTLLSMSCIHNKDFVRGIHFLERSAIYNQSDLEDLICAANVSAIELKNYNETKKYARRALIKYYENPNLKNHVTLNSLGRLLYLLGLSYFDSKDSFMVKECLKIHTSLKNEKQYEINKDLKERLENLTSTNNPMLLYDKELIRVRNLSYDKLQHIFNRSDSIQKINAIKSCKKLTTGNLENYLNNVLSLDSIYGLKGDIYSSKRLLDVAIQNINDAHIKLSSSQGIQLMLRLGRIYSLFKDDKEALDWFFMAKNRCEELGMQENKYMEILQSIATAYIEKDIFWSRLFIEEAIEIYEKINGSIYTQDKTEAYSLLASYAYILQGCNQYNIAEKIYRHILKLCRNSEIIIFALNDYGVMLSNFGRNTEAIYYYEQANKLLPKNSNIINLITAYIEIGRNQKAESIFKQYVASMIETFINTYAKFTNYEIENWCNQSVQELYIYSNCFADKINSPLAFNYGFDATIFSKTYPMLYRSVIGTSNNTNAEELKNDIQQYKDELTKIKDKKSDNPYFLHLKIQQLEDSLKKSTLDLSSRIMREVVTYKDIVESLEEDEIAIEFFESVDLFSDSVSIYYGAYICLPKTEAPLMVKIDPFQKITNIVRNILDETELNTIYSESNDAMYNMIWKNLMPYIDQKKTVYYSTSGTLSFINHDIIHDNEGNMLQDRFNLRRVLSTSQIGAVKKETNNEYHTAVLYGDIDYDTLPSVMSESSNADFYSSHIPDHVVFPSDITRNGWTNLTYSLFEINGITSVMKSVGINTTVFEKKYASEESFRKLDSQSPDIIHIATHGFSAYKHKKFKDNSHISYTEYDQTLSFEGLLLSGANNIWLGKQIPEHVEDGILTAEEISNMDLSGTKLVVLSACDTGKGSINLTGRVNGLQEAFKMAGVESIVMSLWQVPDESTSLLMKEFYEALFNGFNRHDALKIARKKVREIYPDPYYWGAFVILD